MSRTSDESTAPGDDNRREGKGRGGSARGRRPARLLAFQTLYEVDLAHHRPGEVLQRLEAEHPVKPEADAYARELAAGVLRHRDELDRIIHEKAPAWPLNQMSAIDRTILRLGLYECLYGRGTVPVKVAINEAVELAKTFGSESSARFVNGVLGRVVESLPAEREAGPPPRQDG
ncbi:MAG: transcription antitermination factor NusB [Chloroflexi bacterium]|nr:transcription antitermination factor NusB [Chloroflexota bacterium]